MLTTIDEMEMTSFFEQAELDLDALDRYADVAHASFVARDRFGGLVGEYRRKAESEQGDPLRLALGLSLLGCFAEALEWFERAPASKERDYHAAQAALGLGRLEAAIEHYRQAAKRGWDAIDIDLRIAAVHGRATDQAALDKLVRKHERDGQDRAAWYFAAGLLAELRSEHEAALEAFERSLALDPDGVDAMFHCARLYDMGGADDEALELYERLALQPRAHANALLNAAVIYEDIGKYDEAALCLRRVLRAYPNHTRARLFLKDVRSCQQMVIDEVREDHGDTRGRLLDTLLSEYELSVRARNCLKKMNIRTLGELMRLTEEELLAYKNFGETSLNEIKALLAKKGLRLGQDLEEIEVEVVEEAPAPAPPVAAIPSGQQAVLGKSVSDLELSVRARRCLQRLNVRTLADLVQFSEQDLLSTRNFGVTSLNEVKQRLFEHGLQLASQDPG